LLYRRNHMQIPYMATNFHQTVQLYIPIDVGSSSLLVEDELESSSFFT
jgi:hypothetical protein